MPFRSFCHEAAHILFTDTLNYSICRFVVGVTFTFRTSRFFHLLCHPPGVQTFGSHLESFAFFFMMFAVTNCSIVKHAYMSRLKTKPTK